MRGSADKAVLVAVAVSIVVGGAYGLSSLRSELSSECGGFGCMPGSVVLPGKDLHYFFDHASAACAGWGLDDLTPSAAKSARAYAKRTYPVRSYSEMEQLSAYAGCVEGIRSPLHALSYIEAPGGPAVYYRGSAARVCARRGVGRVARELEVAATPMEAAKAYADFKYPADSYGEDAHAMAYKGCLEAFVRRRS